MKKKLIMNQYKIWMHVQKNLKNGSMREMKEKLRLSVTALSYQE